MLEKQPKKVAQGKGVFFKLKLCLLLFTYTLLTGLAYANDYYVDPNKGNDKNNGSINSPWKSIGYANIMLRAGDVLYLRGGEYNADIIRPARSGQPNNYITYKAYQGEKPVLTNANGVSGNTAIVLNKRSYIVIDGINIDGKGVWTRSNTNHWMTLDDSHYCIIQNCDFRYAKGWAGISVDGGSTFNKFLNNNFDYCGIWDQNEGTIPLKGNDAGDLFYLKCGNYNLLEGNTMKHGGHNILNVDDNYNVIRNNVFDGDWSDWGKGAQIGTRAAALTGRPGKNCSGGGNSKDDAGGYNVFENNVCKNTKQFSDNPVNMSMKVQGVNQIVRYNIIGNNWGLAISGVATSAVTHCSKNKIFNNVIFNSGWSAWRIRDYSNVGISIKENVMKNNILYNNRKNPPSSTDDADIVFNLQWIDGHINDNKVNNNVIYNDKKEAVAFIRGEGMRSSLSWHENKNSKYIYDNVQRDPLLTKTNPNVDIREDFYLKPNSPAIDAGDWLTRASGNGSGNTITVEDAGYFFDGFGIVDGDMLQVGSHQPVRITKVDYRNNRITLAKSISWKNGDPVSLPYTGKRPDIGIYEHGLEQQPKEEEPEAKQPEEEEPEAKQPEEEEAEAKQPEEDPKEEAPIEAEQPKEEEPKKEEPVDKQDPPKKLGVYYVDPANGKDNNTGEIEKPLKTIGKVNGLLQAGDTVFLREGEYNADIIRPARSGSAGNYIVYMAFPDEKPLLTNANGTSHKTALVLDDRSYIVVDGIYVDGKSPFKSSNTNVWASLDNASHNIIANCDFKYARGWNGIKLDNGANFNQILHNRLDHCGTWDRGDRQGAGQAMILACAQHNLIEGNHFTRAGHNLLAVYDQNNIIQKNIFDNGWGTDKDGNPIGSRTVALTNAGGSTCEASVGGFNIFEYNLVKNNYVTADGTYPSAITTQGENQIVRFNYIMNEGMEAISGMSDERVVLSDHNRIYNNTIYNSGGLSWKAGDEMGDNAQDNVFKNNISFSQGKHKKSTVGASHIYLDLKGSDKINGNQVAGNCFYSDFPGSSEEVFVNGIGSYDISFFESNYGEFFHDNLNREPGFMGHDLTAVENLQLDYHSPLIDAGTALTYTIGSGSGKVLKVGDARYFTDGFGVVEGDMVKIGNNLSVKIVGVDYGKNELTLENSISWGSKDPVNLPFHGTGPDIGAFESDIITADKRFKEEVENEIVVFPNPSRGLFNLEVTNNRKESLNMEVFNMNGVKVFEHDLDDDLFVSEEVDLSRFPKGIYLLRILSGKTTETRKVVIE